MRLFLVSVSTLICLLMVLLTVRFWGLGQVEDNFSHPFLSGSKPWIIVKCKSEDCLAKSTQMSLENILWLDIKENNSDFYVNDSSEVLATDVVKKYPEHRFIFNLIDNVSGIHKRFVDKFKDLDLNKRLLIQSEYDVVIKSIKDIKPEWVYGTSRSEITQFLAMESLFVHTATRLKGDVYITPYKINNTIVTKQTLLDEVHRRKKDFIVGPVNDEKEFEVLFKQGIDGVITENPEFANKMRSQLNK